MSSLGLNMTSEETPEGSNKPGDNKGGKGGKGGNRKPLIASIALLAVLVGGIGYAAYSFWPSSAPDYTGQGTGRVVVEVKPGQTIAQIGQNLKALGVVASVDAFVAEASANPASQGIQPGQYNMRLQMSATAALEALLDPANRAGVIAVPEGARAAQIVQLAAEASDVPAEELASVVARPDDLPLPSWAKKHTAEGFLFPATYNIGKDVSATEILTPMVRRFDQMAREEKLAEGLPSEGMTPYEVLVVASIVQAEGTGPDFPKIARVIYNRLDAPMRLQMDTTVNYALGISEIDLTKDQMQIDSPYNTYLYDGLPPGPINNPSQEAIQAALNPADGDWLYFLWTDPNTRETKFTSSYEEFQRWNVELYENLARQKAEQGR